MIIITCKACKKQIDYGEKEEDVRSYLCIDRKSEPMQHVCSDCFMDILIRKAEERTNKWDPKDLSPEDKMWLMQKMPLLPHNSKGEKLSEKDLYILMKSIWDIRHDLGYKERPKV